MSTTTSRNNKNILPKQAMQFIGATRVQGGYSLYDTYSGNMLATLTVVEGAIHVSGMW